MMTFDGLEYHADHMFDHEGTCAICDGHYHEHDTEGRRRCRAAFETDDEYHVNPIDARKYVAGTCHCFSPVMEGE